jgi:hypothetical protein
MNVKDINYIAMATLVAGKLSGIAGVALSFTTHRMISGGLLIAAGCFLVATLGLCITNMNKQNKEEV